MHEVLHIIGLCPDSFAHMDLLDIIAANYQSLTETNLKIIKQQICYKMQIK